jgi:hypothetical protein
VTGALDQSTPHDVDARARRRHQRAQDDLRQTFAALVEQLGELDAERKVLAGLRQFPSQGSLTASRSVDRNHTTWMRHAVVTLQQPHRSADVRATWPAGSRVICHTCSPRCAC